MQFLKECFSVRSRRRSFWRHRNLARDFFFCTLPLIFPGPVTANPSSPASPSSKGLSVGNSKTLEVGKGRSSASQLPVSSRAGNQSVKKDIEIPKLEPPKTLELSWGLGGASTAHYNSQIKSRPSSCTFEAGANLGEEICLVELELSEKGWTLLANSRSTQKRGTLKATIRIPVRSDQNISKLQLISPAGEIHEATLTAGFSKHSEWKEKREKIVALQAAGGVQTSQVAQAGKRWSVSGGLGTTHLLFEQTVSGVKNSYAMHALTAKAAFNFLVWQPWILLGASTFGTIAPFRTSIAQTAVRFFGLNGRVGFGFPPLLDGRLRLSASLGVYWIMMAATPTNFGFGSLIGPQFFPAATLMVTPQDRVSTYFKIAPVSSGFGFLALSSREIAFGVGYSRQISGYHSFGISMDYSHLQVTLGANSAMSETFSWGASYSY